MMTDQALVFWVFLFNFLKAPQTQDPVQGEDQNCPTF